METLPIKSYPYTLEDLSVVIPQASQYVKRIKWFIPQYIKGTPPEVVKNTIVTYDPEDNETKIVLEENGVRGITIEPPHSTYKMQAGFREVKTRLCVRMHNDVYIARNDWAESLVEQFNNNYPQIVSFLHISGGVGRNKTDKIKERYSFFDPQFEGETTSCSFMTAFFMASQSYVFKSLYPEVVELNDGKMDKEDVMTTLLASVYNIKIAHWSNINEFIRVVSKAYGDFENEQLPTQVENFITPENKDKYPKAMFEFKN